MSSLPHTLTCSPLIYEEHLLLRRCAQTLQRIQLSAEIREGLTRTLIDAFMQYELKCFSEKVHSSVRLVVGDELNTFHNTHCTQVLCDSCIHQVSP